MSYEPVLLPKFSPDGTIILAKEQVHNSYTFWAMSILIFSPFANFGNQSLDQFEVIEARPIFEQNKQV